MSDSVLMSVDSEGITTLTLNRPELHNAFDDALIRELFEHLNDLKANDKVRLLVLRAMGKSFSAGADLNWMRRMTQFSIDENRDDARQLARLMRQLNEFTKPTIAVVQGAAYGGGVGLVACCDIAIGTPQASFCLSEVRLGLIPAVISPYVIDAIGARQARRYFLTAERFDAHQAVNLGLLHDVVERDSLEHRLQTIVDEVLKAGPQALKAAKQLISTVAQQPFSENLIEQTVNCIADIRVSEEAREGLDAFLSKRRPNWLVSDD